MPKTALFDVSSLSDRQSIVAALSHSRTPSRKMAVVDTRDSSRQCSIGCRGHYIPSTSRSSVSRILVSLCFTVFSFVRSPQRACGLQSTPRLYDTPAYKTGTRRVDSTPCKISRSPDIHDISNLLFRLSLW